MARLQGTTYPVLHKLHERLVLVVLEHARVIQRPRAVAEALRRLQLIAEHGLVVVTVRLCAVASTSPCTRTRARRWLHIFIRERRLALACSGS